MNKYAILHRPESNFAYATAKNKLIVILRVAANDELEKVEILYNNKYAFTKTRSRISMARYAEDGLFAYYRAEITLPDARFAYIFKITEKGKVYYYSEEGLSEEYEFNLAYYTFFQFAFINGVDVMPVLDWAGSAVFYQIFIDRFARGDYSKDDKYINTPWDSEIDRYSFTGGDLDGVREKLPYLKEMGINALYLTPVFLSDSNHKYSVKDYLTVDPQFGDNEKLKGLLTSAHGLGMKVIIDTVFNHCDAGHEYFKDVVQNGKASKYYDWFVIDGEYPDEKRGNYACFAECKHMPKWNTSNPSVRRYLTDIALEYLKTGFDGLRLDVADEISHEMWRQLRREVKEKYPSALILGEIWHDNEHWLKGDQFDGVMNYKLQKILVDYFGKAPVSAKNAADRMNGILVANTEQANANSLNFLDNHDTPRFLRTTGGNKDKLLCALCAMVLFPGMPCVFYGTELPLDGAGDPDCRKPFDWSFKGREDGYKDNFYKILALKKLPALQGTGCKVRAENGVLSITREADGESVTAYFNTSGKAKRIEVQGEVIFGLNYCGDRILNDGTVVIKNIKN
ncbi:MAG: glycoside hydrolase family 13 protein [Clostridia bacterium]|nr:glycoside hydrolase family 13 protein [Clostridia bacterium]